MGDIPGVRLDVTGASGSQGLLAPQSGWKFYVLPRGGYASQGSAGTLITFDSAAVASRFAVNNWIQAGLLTANLRQVSGVGGNSITISGANLTVAKNDRIFIIGNTQPTVSGGSATYTTPDTKVYQRDDDTSDLYTNSMITTNSDGLVQFFSSPTVYDAIVQDGNQTNQGFFADLVVGADGISTAGVVTFGATTTVNAGFGVTGWVHLGNTVTIGGQLGVTGWATFGQTVTMNANAGVTGTFTVGQTATFSGPTTFGTTVTSNYWNIFGGTCTFNGAAGFSQTVAFAGLSITGLTVGSYINCPTGSSGIGTSTIAFNAIHPAKAEVSGTTGGAVLVAGITRMSLGYTASSGNVGALILWSLPYVAVAQASLGARVEAFLTINGASRVTGHFGVSAFGSSASGFGMISGHWFEPAMGTTMTTISISDVLLVSGSTLGGDIAGVSFSPSANRLGLLTILEHKR